MKISVQLQPNAKKNSIEIIGKNAFKIKVTAQPIDNKANQACIKLLSKFLNMPKSFITLTSGMKSKNKTFDILNLDEDIIKKNYPN